MNILMLTNREFVDSWFDCLYNGLRIKYGNAVHIYPYREHYSDIAPSNMIVYSFDHNELSIERLLRNAKIYDLLIVGSIALEKDYAQYRELIDACRCPLIIYHAHENAGDFNYPDVIGKPILAEFHKETYSDADGIYSMSHPIREEYFVPFNRDKKYDISAIFGGAKGHEPAHYKRKILVDIINDFFPNSIAEYDSSMTYNEFRQATSESWIGISMRGVGYQTSRYYEIPAYGAALVSERLKVVIPNDFSEEDVSYFDYKFDNSIPEKVVLHNLVELLKGLLSDKDELCRRIESTRQHLRLFHNPIAVADRVIRIVTERMRNA